MLKTVAGNLNEGFWLSLKLQKYSSILSLKVISHMNNGINHTFRNTLIQVYTCSRLMNMHVHFNYELLFHINSYSY